MINRRRVITILAGAAALPVLGATANAQVIRWRGIALGAQADIVLDHPEAERLIARSVDEIHRLENIFSIYKTDSQLAKLNRDGVLHDPAFEMIELLSICSGLHASTDGAFDPTVQSLWALYAENKYPNKKQISHALSQTGWQHVRYSTSQVSFDKPGVQLTLNGIAQGFIADKVVAMLRSEGVENALVNTGEIFGLGMAEDGNKWNIKLGDAQGELIHLNNAAIATSAPLGTSFDEDGTKGHIIDPRTGYPDGHWSQVSVISTTAAQADGLSTAFCLMEEEKINLAKGNSKVFLTNRKL